MYQLTKNIAANIWSHIYSALRYSGVVFDKFILSSSPILVGAKCVGTSDSWYGAQNEQENTQNGVIEGDISREMTVNTDQKYQETVEAAANMLFQLKQMDQLNIGHNNMAIPDVEEVSHVSGYPLLKYMGFDTDISDEVEKLGYPLFWEKLFASINTLKIRWSM